jgi:ABC-type oligopeptide transport system substrate-binding subunit
MKKLRSVLAAVCLLAVVSAPVLTTGCHNTATSQSTKYKTLAAVGAAAQAAMDSTAALLKAGTITVPQFQRVAEFYDGKFQPAFRFAVVAAQADTSSLASPDLTALLVQFTTLVAEVTSK